MYVKGMMLLTDEDRLKLRGACKDEQSYQLVLSLYEEKLAEQRQQEQQLAVPDEFQELFRRSMDAYIIFDEQSRFMDVNTAACELFGYTQEELKTFSWSDVIDETEIEDSYLRDRWLGDKYLNGYVMIRRQNGEFRPVQFLSIRYLTPDRHVSILKDLTSQKLLEDELRRTIESLLETQRIANLGTWDVNLRTGDMVWSDEMFNICGRKRSEMVMTLEEGFRVFHPDDLVLLKSRIESDQKDFQEEVRVIHPNGDVRWVIAQGITYVDDLTQDTYLKGIILDITRRKHAELELLIGQQYFQSVLDVLPLNVYRIDTAGQLTFGNQFLLDSLELTPEQLIGNTAYDFYPTELAQKYRQDDQRVIDTAEILHTVEENQSPVTGQTHYVETYKIPILNSQGEVEAIQGVFWDVTERIKAEDELKRSEARATALLEAIPDMVFHLREDGTFLDCVADPVQLMVDSVEDVIGANIRDFFSNSLVEDMSRKIKYTLEHHEMQKIEYAIEFDGGVFVDYEARIVQLNEQEVYVIVRDITELNQSIQREIDFQVEKTRLELLSHFIRSASHEFRTPLATISTSLYLLQHTPYDPVHQKQKFFQIDEQVKRLSQLVNKQMMIVQLNHDPSPITTMVQIDELIDEIQYNLKELYDPVPSFKVKIDTEILQFKAHLEYLSIALTYLLDNAFRFSPDDGVVQLVISSVERAIIIQVIDNGYGISEESLPHVFELFWRADQAHSTPGFGLGLSIARKVIDLHNGQIDIESKLDEVTTVHITLPNMSLLNSD